MRTQIYRSLAVLSWWSDKALRDDGKITIEDIDETALAAGGIAFIWKGNVILASVPGLWIVESIVASGAVASYAIGGIEGVDNYAEFISDPGEWATLGVGTTMDYSLPIIYEEVIAPKIVDPIVGWVETKIDQGIALGKASYRYGEKKVDQGLAWAMRGLPSIKYF